MFEKDVEAASTRLDEAARERGYPSWSLFVESNFTMETRRLWETIVFGKPEPFGPELPEEEDEKDG